MYDLPPQGILIHPKIKNTKRNFSFFDIFLFDVPLGWPSLNLRQEKKTENPPLL